MGTELLPALTALDDSAKPWRLESDGLLYLAINHRAATPFLGVARLNPRIYKAAAGDVRSLEFRIGEPNEFDTSDASTLAFAIKHNASGELEIGNASGTGLKVSSAGAVSIGGSTLPTFLTASFSHDPPSIAANGFYNFNVTVTGAQVTNSVVMCTFHADLPGTLIVDYNDQQGNFAQITSANTVNIGLKNDSASSYNPPAIAGRIVVIQY